MGMSLDRDENALKTISVAGHQDIMSDPILMDLENERGIISLVLFHSAMQSLTLLADFAATC